MLERAYGKINLSLDITGKREDGYHTLESIFLPIDFFDMVNVTPNDTMEYECNKRYIKFNETNTVYQAVELMKKEFNIKDNFKIVLTKHLPTQAGLAGGSCDGAAIIRLFNKIYKLNLSKEKIQELCLSIGADVLFTYYNKPALVSGIGEKIEEIKVLKDYYILLVKPRFGVSTKECYKQMDNFEYYHPNISELKKALEEGRYFKDYLGNSMETAAINLLPDIQKAKDDLIEAGAEFALMSGSGSTVFTMSEDRNLIYALNSKLRDKGYFVRATKVLK